MADQFQASSCSSTSGSGIWWSSASPPPDMFEPRPRTACGELPLLSISNSSITFQDNHVSASTTLAAGLMLESAPHPVDFGRLSSPAAAVEWGLPFLGIEPSQINTEMLENMDRSFLLDPFLSAASTLGLPLHGQILEQEMRLERSLDGSQLNTISLNSDSSSPAPSHPKQQQQQQLQFSNEAPFWNPTVASSAAATTAAAAQYVSFHHARQLQSAPDQNLSYSTNPILKTTCTTTEKRSESDQVLIKKPRIETPSPLPTFKVRKEKLGDRITALQQLVSPFGKTDTASVLHEAIEYIKFLHDQVRVLSAPYLKNGHQTQQQIKAVDKSSQKSDKGQSQNLTSRGLCLVPIPSTFVANEMPTDFWTPSFIGGIKGGAFR